MCPFNPFLPVSMDLCGPLGELMDRISKATETVRGVMYCYKFVVNAGARTRDIQPDSGLEATL